MPFTQKVLDDAHYDERMAERAKELREINKEIKEAKNELELTYRELEKNGGKRKGKKRKIRKRKKRVDTKKADYGKHRTLSEAQHFRAEQRANNLSKIVHARLTIRTNELLQAMLNEREISLRELLEECVMLYYGYSTKVSLDVRKETARLLQDFLTHSQINYSEYLRVFTFKNDDMSMIARFQLPNEKYRSRYFNALKTNPLKEWREQNELRAKGNAITEGKSELTD